ncbi:MAG: tRNA 2-selenouridine(34) synthase MnmH [Denitrovibrio sp.]|nr:MAG: tRNA 2-selenouridine(34) synthase MnmH [Denitrovibrio sp.]
MSLNEELELSYILDKGLENINLVDVRSPSEYVEDHIPTAVNIPLLDDEERKQVGICYKQVGPKEARVLGVDIVSPKLPQFIRDFLEIKQNNKITVAYCWRGGLRSNSAAGLVRIAGVQVYTIKGGWKEYRRYVADFIENLPLELNFINFYGPTGCAKTEILRKLHKDGLNVLDLEMAAAHKGSSFGRIDEPEYKNVTQKNFESKIWHTFYRNEGELFLCEGESKKIGKVSIPNPVYERMNSGVSVVADTSLDFRIAFTVENYKPDRYIEEIRGSLLRLKRFIGSAKIAELSAMLDRGDYESFTRDMLVEYYDPLYMRSTPEKPDYVIKYESIEEGSEKLAQIYKNSAAS